MTTYPNGSRTTDDRYVKVGDAGDEWWDTTGTALVPGSVVEAYMVANRVGIMVFARTKTRPKMRPSFDDLHALLDEWIAEGGELAKVCRIRKARLPDPDDYSVLRAEVENIARYFGKSFNPERRD